MQDKDEALRKIKEQLVQNKIANEKPYFLEEEILKRKIDDGKTTIRCDRLTKRATFFSPTDGT